MIRYRSHSFVASALLGASAVLAQNGHSLVENRVQTTRGWEFQIYNSSPQALEAYRVSIQCPSTAGGARPRTYERNEDALLNFNPNIVLHSGQTRTFIIPSDVADCPGGVIGAIFDDGITKGDAQAISYLYEMRQGLYAGLLVAQPLLEKISNKQSDPSSEVRTLEAERTRITTPKSMSTAKWLGETHAFTIVSELLKNQVDLRVPSDETPQRQPRISEFARTTGLAPQQAHAVIVGRKLGEWITALSDNLGAKQTSTKVKAQ